jgi:site-specific recombinase XerD
MACRLCLKPFEDYCQSRGWSLDTFTSEQLAQYREHLSWSPRRGRLPAASTVYQHLRFVRAFLRWNQQGFGADLVLPRPSFRERRLLNQAELDEMLAAPDPTQPLGLRDRALLRVIAELGLACHRLNVDDFCRAPACLAGLPVGAVLYEVLLRYLDRGRPALLKDEQEKALFLAQHGGRTGAPNIGRLTRYYSRGIVSPRDFHRSWLTHRQAQIGRRLRGV